MNRFTALCVCILFSISSTLAVEKQISFVKYNSSNYSDIINSIDLSCFESLDYINISESTSLYEMKYGSITLSYKNEYELFEGFPISMFIDKKCFILDLTPFYLSKYQLSKKQNILKYIGILSGGEVLYLRKEDPTLYTLSQLIDLEYGSAADFLSEYLEESELSIKYNQRNGLNSVSQLLAKEFLIDDYYYYADVFPSEINHIQELLLLFVEKSLGHTLGNNVKESMTNELKVRLLESNKNKPNYVYYYGSEGDAYTLLGFNIKDLLQDNLSIKEFMTLEKSFEQRYKERIIAYNFLIKDIVYGKDRDTNSYLSDVEEFTILQDFVYL